MPPPHRSGRYERPVSYREQASEQSKMAVSSKRAVDKLGVFESVPKMLSKLHKRGFRLAFSSHTSLEISWEKGQNFIAFFTKESDDGYVVAIQWNIDPIARVIDTKYLCKKLVNGLRLHNDDAGDTDIDPGDTDNFESVHAFVLCNRSTKLARKAAFEIVSELDFFEKITFCDSQAMLDKLL